VWCSFQGEIDGRKLGSANILLEGNEEPLVEFGLFKEN
jgi:hypothetical protein